MLTLKHCMACGGDLVVAAVVSDDVVDYECHDCGAGYSAVRECGRYTIRAQVDELEDVPQAAPDAHTLVVTLDASTDLDAFDERIGVKRVRGRHGGDEIEVTYHVLPGQLAEVCRRVDLDDAATLYCVDPEPGEL
jgi:hypothetical protein